VIDRAEDGDGDGDAVLGARNRPDNDGQPDRSSTALRAADSAEADESPAADARTDAVPATAEQRATAYQRHRDTVDHTYDVVRIEAGDGAQAEAPQAPPRGATARDETPEPDADQDQDASQRRVADEDKEGTAPDEDTETRPAGAGTRDGATQPRSAGAADRAGPDAGTGEAGTADAADWSARDAWAGAVTELRAEWEEHEQRFPERSRLTPTAQSDGGWLADEDRGLTPEQNADASKACEDIRAEGKEVILPAMQRVEAADPDRHLAGLEHMLKGEDRLKEKVAERLRYDPEWPSEQAAREVPDAVRFTLEYSDDHYTDGVGTDVDRLKAEGFELIKLKNLWVKDQYKGTNSQWRVPETGQRFEVQFHTSISFEAKELTHKAYERLRNPATSADEEVQLEDYQRRVSEQIPLPPRVFEIKDYPPERRDG
jgi:hypothetical protein